MSSRKVVALVAAIVGMACVVGATVVAQQPPVVGAGPAPVGFTLPWATVLGLFGSGSFLTSLFALWQKVQPVVLPNFPNIQFPTPSPGPAPVIPKVIADGVELIDAAKGYYAKQDDKVAQRRLALATLNELQDMAELQSPEIAAVLNQLGTVIMSKWYPVQAGVAK